MSMRRPLFFGVTSHTGKKVLSMKHRAGIRVIIHTVLAVICAVSITAPACVSASGNMHPVSEEADIASHCIGSEEFDLSEPSEIGSEYEDSYMILSGTFSDNGNPADEAGNDSKRSEPSDRSGTSLSFDTGAGPAAFELEEEEKEEEEEEEEEEEDDEDDDDADSDFHTEEAGRKGDLPNSDSASLNISESEADGFGETDRLDTASDGSSVTEEELVGASVFRYAAVSGGISVTGYTGTAANVTIPGTIDGKKVLSVGEGAFRGKNITSVTLPASLTSLGRNCFYGCENLVSVDLGSCSALKSIGEGAFAVCTSLTSVVIPDSVTRICDDAFFRCSVLKKVTFGSSVEEIGMYAFAFCDKLTSVSFPVSVKTVGIYAFARCVSLRSVAFGSVKDIGNYAFSFTDLTSVNIPASCKTIGTGAFHDCDSLSGVTLREGLTGIGRIAFANCPKLKIATIPDSVTWIGDGAIGCSWGWDGDNTLMMSGEQLVGEGISAEESEEFLKELTEVQTDEELVGAGEYITPNKAFIIRAYRSDGSARKYADNYGMVFRKISKSITDAVISGINTSYNYTGSPQKPAPVVKDGNTTLVKNKDYSLGYDHNVDPGTAVITVTGKGNYKGSQIKNFTITPYPVYGKRITATTAHSTYDYTGNPRKPGVTVKFNGKTLVNGTDYTLTYKNNTNPGTATITLTGKGKFRLTRDLTFKLALTVPTVTGAVKKSAGTMCVTWKKYDKARGYQVRIARGDVSNIYTVGGTSSLSKTISGLKTGQTWRVYVRSYQKIGTKYYYSSWSEVRYVKV